LATVFVVVQVAVLIAARHLPRSPRICLRLLAGVYTGGWLMAGLLYIRGRFGGLKSLLYGPHATLSPPDEVMGNAWAVVAPILVFDLAQLLNVLPLILLAWLPLQSARPKIRPNLVR
jgi:hypothetical protein